MLKIQNMAQTEKNNTYDWEPAAWKILKEMLNC